MNDTIAPEWITWPSPLRIGALFATGVVLASFLTTVYYVVNIVGDPRELLVLTVIALLAATVSARFLSVRRAAIVAAALLSIGVTWYLAELPTEKTFALVTHIEYVIALLSGHSVLEIVNLREWVLAVTPAPVFLTWFLALRRRYGAAAVVGGSTVGFFVLTGDATIPVAILGSVGVLALLGLGTLDRAGATLAEAEVVSALLAAVVVVSLTVSLVPQGAAMSYAPGTGFVASAEYADGGTLEADLLSADDRIRIAGRAELSTKVRWTVESDAKQYWRAGAYDLYTGDGWTRSAGTTADRSALRRPAGSAERVTQRFTAETQINTLPAAWRPTSVGWIDARVTGFGGLQPQGPVQSGESYRVVSYVPDPSVSDLQEAGTDYPDGVRSRFLQLPASTPDRVEQTTATITENAETPYETAITVEQWLRNEKGYSLSVDRPSGDIAASFLFEMEQGYCTYFATTMTVMLRSQGIPARMAVGYTPGEQTGENTWTVRGYNSHAWVEVYFPDVGWIQFDPTPPGPRVQAEQDAFADTRSADDPDVPPGTAGIARPGAPEWIPGPESPQNDTLERSNETQATSTAPTTETNQPVAPPSNDRPSAPNRERLFLGAIAGVGLIAGIRRSGASGRLYRAIRLRWQPRSDPETDIERAYERLEQLLEREHRPRRVGETARQYLDTIEADERASEVALLYERARYAGEADAGAADRAVELVDELVTDH
ncbi:MAG: transglutaminaseTgpA domain-containing protein [Halapricum sp.]